MISEFTGRRLTFSRFAISTEVHDHGYVVLVVESFMPGSIVMSPDQIDQMLELIKVARHDSCQRGVAPVKMDDTVASSPGFGK